ncbi:MAG: hypothetical protein K2O10_01780 [Muribaculaceae bacterium]|nr:hypothetical protein [Muribaculaceae bacterium]
MKRNRIIALFPLSLTILALAGGCSRHTPQVSTTDELAAKAITVEACTTADTTFMLDGYRVPTVEIERIYPTEHQDAYISMRVFALRDTSTVNSGLARIVAENFGLISGGDLTVRPGRRSPADVEKQMDYYGAVFVDTILPQLKGSVELGFFMNMDLRPAWADPEHGLITYSSYAESCGGGACDVDAYYVTFKEGVDHELTFDELVPDPAMRQKLRQALVDEIAKAGHTTAEAMLRQVTDYLTPGAIRMLTPATFPVDHVALMGESLVFAYRQGSIAPVGQGCPMFMVPMVKE